MNSTVKNKAVEGIKVERRIQINRVSTFQIIKARIILACKILTAKKALVVIGETVEFVEMHEAEIIEVTATIHNDLVAHVKRQKQAEEALESFSKN